MLEGVSRFARILQFFGQKKLVLFQFGDLFFKGRGHTGIFSFNNPVHQLVDFLVGPGDILFDCFHSAFGMTQHLFPGIPEHGIDKINCVLCRLQGFKNGLKCAFQLRAGNGLAIAHTALLEAKIIGMIFTGFASGPAGGQRTITIAAGDKPAKGEVGVNVLAGRSLCPFF